VSDRTPCMRQVLERSRAEGTDLLVLLAIAKHAYPNGTGAHPGEATIARLAKKSDRTVRRSIDRLVELGELVVNYKAGPGGRTNTYTIVLPDPDIAMSTSDFPDPDIAVSGSDFPNVDIAVSRSTRTSSAPTRTPSVADPDIAVSAKQLEQSLEQPGEQSSVRPPTGDRTRRPSTSPHLSPMPPTHPPTTHRQPTPPLRPLL
jgi:helix-turn-helix protein